MIVVVHYKLGLAEIDFISISTLELNLTHQVVLCSTQIKLSEPGGHSQFIMDHLGYGLFLLNSDKLCLSLTFIFFLKYMYEYK